MGGFLSQASEERAQQKVEDAIKRGHISGGMRDWALALCRSDEASFDAFLDATPPAFAHLLTRSGTAAIPPQARPAPDGSDAALAVCAQLGLKPEALSQG